MDDPGQRGLEIRISTVKSGLPSCITPREQKQAQSKPSKKCCSSLCCSHSQRCSAMQALAARRNLGFELCDVVAELLPQLPPRRHKLQFQDTECGVSSPTLGFPSPVKDEKCAGLTARVHDETGGPPSSPMPRCSASRIGIDLTWALTRKEADCCRRRSPNKNR
jgi:hypothetical protein